MDVKENIPIFSTTSNVITQLRTEEQQEGEQPGAVEGEAIDDYTYLKEMGINRNWEIPRERLTITEQSLGGGEFGVVRKGIYFRRDGQKLPVAIKMLKGL